MAEVLCQRHDTGQKRFEVPSDYGPHGPPVLVMNMDECGTNLCPIQFLVGHLHLRLVSVRDAAHRHWRDYRLALGEADLWSDVLEKMHCMGVKHGPWNSQQFWNQTQQAVEHHIKHASSNDPLFLALWPAIADDIRHKLTSEPGSEEEREQVWKVLKQSKCLRVSGNRATLTRWFEFLAQYKGFDEEYHIHLFQFCLALYYTGVFKSVGEMPIWGGSAKARVQKTELKVKAAGSTGKTMAQVSAEEQLAEARVKCKNAIHLAALCLGDAGAHRRGRLIIEVGSPLYDAFSKELAGCSDPKQTRLFMMSYAKFGYSIVLRKRCGLSFGNPRH